MTEPLQITDAELERQKKAVATMRGVSSAASELLAREKTLSDAIKVVLEDLREFKAKVGSDTLQFTTYRYGGDGKGVTTNKAIDLMKEKLERVL